MSDEPLDMWSYYRDKYGSEQALRDYYPDLLAANPELSLALNLIKLCEHSIDAAIEKLKE